MNPFAPNASLEPDGDVAHRVADLLAGYLLSATGSVGPGTDGLTVSEAVGTLYPAEVRAGHVPDPTELVRRHPELADDIVTFFNQGGVGSS